MHIIENNDELCFTIQGKPVESIQGIKHLRKIKDWSTTELAEKLGVSKRTIEGYELGRPVPKMAMLLIQRLLQE